jgi:hypothetical protein
MQRMHISALHTLDNRASATICLQATTGDLPRRAASDLGTCLKHPPAALAAHAPGGLRSTTRLYFRLKPLNLHPQRLPAAWAARAPGGLRSTTRCRWLQRAPPHALPSPASVSRVTSCGQSAGTCGQKPQLSSPFTGTQDRA